MVSYCQKNRSVLLLSSMHYDNAIDEETGDDHKSVIITDYNHTKIGVDLVNQLYHNYKEYTPLADGGSLQPNQHIRY